MNNAPRPVGVFGGTFDPIHLGHVRLAHLALARLDLDRVLLIPSRVPPHRRSPRATAEDRWAMVCRVAERDPRFVADDVELVREGPSWMVDTLRTLAQREVVRAHGRPPAPLVLLLGFDAFLGLPSWSRWRSVFELAHVAVFSRPDSVRTLPDELAEVVRTRGADGFDGDPAGRVVACEELDEDISSSAIRDRIARGEDVQNLLTPEVWSYISRRHIYR